MIVPDPKPIELVPMTLTRTAVSQGLGVNSSSDTPGSLSPASGVVGSVAGAAVVGSMPGTARSVVLCVPLACGSPRDLRWSAAAGFTPARIDGRYKVAT